MESLSSAVTLAQTQRPKQPQSRNLKATGGEYKALDSIDAVVASAKQGARAAHPETCTSQTCVVDSAHEVQSMKLVSEHAIRAAAKSIHNGASVQVPHHRTRQCRRTMTKQALHQDETKSVCTSTSQSSRRPTTSTKAPLKPPGKLIPARVIQAQLVRSPHPLGSEESTGEGAGWTSGEVKELLHVCSRRVRPDTANFWVKVAKYMPGEPLVVGLI